MYCTNVQVKNYCRRDEHCRRNSVGRKGVGMTVEEYMVAQGNTWQHRGIHGSTGEYMVGQGKWLNHNLSNLTFHNLHRYVPM